MHLEVRVGPPRSTGRPAPEIRRERGPETRSERLVSALYRRRGIVFAAVSALTLALMVPLVALAPSDSASTEPDGPVFDARDRIDERFVSSVHPVFVVIEDDGGDILRAEPLRRLLAAEDDLRADPELGPNLLRYFDVESRSDVVGIITLADLVDARIEGGLATADDDQVKAAGGRLIAELGERSEILGLSAASRVGDDGRWVVPAVTTLVVSDNQSLGFGNTSVNLGGDTEVEEYDRLIQDRLRTAEGLSIWGIAIDVNLTSQEQGAVAGPFIGLTILAVLAIVGLTFRSYWVVATVGALLLGLIIWLKGISNLIGLKDDLVLSLIVPVAMISFGVDFAFHAIGRYREERAASRGFERALVVGLAAVSGALILALTSDAAAFLANLSSGIESIIQFGLGAAIALAAAYLLLGIVAPLVVATIESRVPEPAPGPGPTAIRIAGSIAAAAAAMASVLLLVFILPIAGVIATIVTVVVTLVIPYAVRRRAEPEVAPDVDVDVELDGRPGPAAASAHIGAVIAAVARRRAIVLPLAVAVTAVASVYALRVDAAFDVEDFFSSDTDFVVGLNQLDEHVGDRGGEPALVYVEADLTDPEKLRAVRSGLDEIQALEVDTLARDDDGVVIDGGIFSVFDAVWASPTAQGLIASASGIELTDADRDAIPDSPQQIAALIEVTSGTGVPFDTERLALTPDDVATTVDLDAERSATVFELGLVNSRSQEAVSSARDALDPIAASLADQLGPESTVQVTGSPFVRVASLDATRRALNVSLPIALVLCLTIAALFLRSIRYGLASIVPILMVVAWLYGFMELAGYAINIVTATIAAVSIGIGIDFALHFIARYREELARSGDRDVAVRAAGEGTGTALVASAASSAIGFGIMAFAPMPLFAAYGLLTALMIAMALVATLAVLPGLLVSITSDRA
ncbi:MAG: MMPL family transporter [Acidimicrobiia bacterium]|nr:MMPL family transporter [Acidimicrobiia bacterium]